jgi:hypothetical protein
MALAQAKSGDAASIAGYLGEDESFGEAITNLLSLMRNKMSVISEPFKRLPILKGFLLFVERV